MDASLLQGEHAAREIPEAQLRVLRLPLSVLVTDPKDGACIARAYLEHRYTQQEIADHLGVRYSTVSRRMHAIDSCRRRNTMRDCWA